MGCGYHPTGGDTGPPELGLRLVIVYKLVKACGELLLAALLSGLLLDGAADRVRALDAALRAHLTAAWSLRLTELLARAATPHNVALTAGALLFDGALTLCEGWALYRSFAWAPWLVVITTGSLLPLEVLELARRPRAGRLLILVINLAVVRYLGARAARTLRHGPLAGADETSSRVTTVVRAAWGRGALDASDGALPGGVDRARR